MYEEFLVGVIVFALIYGLIKFFTRPRISEVEQELEYILNSDEFKVKGKYED